MSAPQCERLFNGLEFQHLFMFVASLDFCYVSTDVVFMSALQFFAYIQIDEDSNGRYFDQSL